MKSKDFLKEGFVEDAASSHKDHEVQMARKDCYYAAEHALAIHKLLKHISENQGIEGWVASKITLASDYLNTVREYLEYEMMDTPDTDAIATDVGINLPIAEGRVKQALADIEELKPAEFKKKYGMSKDEAKKGLKLPEKQPVKNSQQGVAEGSEEARVFYAVQDPDKSYHIYSMTNDVADYAEFQGKFGRKLWIEGSFTDVDDAHRAVHKHKQKQGVAEEQINELSKDKLTAYRDRARASQSQAYDAKMAAGRQDDWDSFHKHNATQTKRGFGLGRLERRGLKPFGEDIAQNKEDLSQLSTERLQAYVKKVSGGGVPAFGSGAKLKRVQQELKRREQNVKEAQGDNPALGVDQLSGKEKLRPHTGVGPKPGTQKHKMGKVAHTAKSAMDYVRGKPERMGHIEEMTAGSVATVNNPDSKKPKSQVGSLFGGSYGETNATKTNKKVVKR